MTSAQIASLVYRSSATIAPSTFAHVFGLVQGYLAQSARLTGRATHPSVRYSAAHQVSPECMDLVPIADFPEEICPQLPHLLPTSIPRCTAPAIRFRRSRICRTRDLAGASFLPPGRFPDPGRPTARSNRTSIRVPILNPHRSTPTRRWSLFQTQLSLSQSIWEQSPAQSRMGPLTPGFLPRSRRRKVRDGRGVPVRLACARMRDEAARVKVDSQHSLRPVAPNR
jgi:hypothetical protein